MIRNATALTDQVLSNATAALVGTLQERTHALTHPRLTWCKQTGSSLMPSHGLHRSARLTPPLRCCCRPSCVLLLSALLTVQVRRLRWKCTVFLQFHHYR